MTPHPPTQPRPFPLGITPKLEIIPLGGLGEFGMNMMAYRAGGEILLIDCGASFPDATLPGVELIVPDFSFLREHAHEIKAIFLTHGHEDHIGAVPYLLREMSVPVYGTRFTLELLKTKFADHPGLLPERFEVIEPGARIDFASFSVSCLRVNHSICDAVAMVLTTPLGVIVHTGDFRIDTLPDDSDPFDYAGFAELGRRGVFALLSDSTNVERAGFTASEQEVGRQIERIVEDAPGRVIVSLFASSVPRLKEVLRIAERHERRVCLVGRSVVETLRIARELGRLSPRDSTMIAPSQLNDYFARKLLIIVTGSQGEPRSALTRIANNEHKEVKIIPGDTVIMSSRIIPGHERNVGALINLLSQQGAEVITERSQAVHTSGHAHAGELATMLNLVRPRWFMPIHGEYYQLRRHARLAVQCGVAEEHVIIATNGDVVAFTDESSGISGQVPTGRQFIDGESLLNISHEELRERRKIGETGLVVAVLIVNRETHAVLQGPEFVTRGFVYELPQGHLIDGAAGYLLDVIDDLSPATRADLDAFKEEVRRALRRHFNRVVGRKPVVIPLILCV